MNDKLEVVTEVVGARMETIVQEYGDKVVSVASACNAIVAAAGAMGSGRVDPDEGGSIIAESIVRLIYHANLDPTKVQQASEAIFNLTHDIETALNSDQQGTMEELLVKIKERT